MVQQLVPQSQMQGMAPNDPFMQVLDKLAQALGGMAQTQQEILNRLSAAPISQNTTPVHVACSYTVTPFYQHANVRDQLDWLERNWLGFHLDGTQKQKLQITAFDIQEHQRIVETFRQMHNL